MSTLTTMLARIADELARSDLTSQIRYAITDAIERYQPERMWFNESRGITFATVAGTSDYTALTGDVSHTKDLYAIDYLMLSTGATQIDTLCKESPERIEYLLGASNSQNQPYMFAYYNKTIRLYPIPNDAWTVRIAGHIKRAAPASDDEADNVWMTDAERLIRARAKYNLAVDVLQDEGLAVRMTAAVTEAHEQLKGRTNKQLGSGSIAPMCF